MHSFSSSLHHCVFATKGREALLTPAIRERLWPYFGGIARDNGMKALAIGGHSFSSSLPLRLRDKRARAVAHT
jgi:hypothetical protein